MRILIGYNGSDAAEAALDDLSNAGLSANAEVLLISIAESWLPPKTVTEAREVADKGRRQILDRHASFTVRTEISTGSPANEILARAEEFQPDLIILGEPLGESLGGHMFLGHTSHKVVTEAKSSVRIARTSTHRALNGQRILVGFDGSAGAIRSVRTISSRRWPAKTQVRLLAIADASVLGAIGRFTPQMKDAAIEARFAAQWAETLAAESLSKLQEAGVSPAVEVRFGNPKDELLRHAGEWDADMIFVGPHSAANSFERFLIGSVSAAVAARANCPVEIVRGYSPG